MKYVYYAPDKTKTPAKRTLNEGLTVYALADEGFYAIASDTTYKNLTISQIERLEGRKARGKKRILRKRGQKKPLIA